MDLLFFGNTEFSLPSAQTILSSQHSINGVITLRDRPMGRGLSEVPTPTKEWAQGEALELIEVDGTEMENLAKRLDSMKWDAGVVVAFGRKIPQDLLEKAPRGFVNLHPSLLPRYRGAAPIQRAIMEGANLTGVTTILMNEELDQGPILMHREEPILDEDNSGTLESRMSHIGAKVLLETLDGLEMNKIKPSPQDDGKATYAPSVTKRECNIDWSMSGERVRDLVRALNPRPGAYTFFREKRVKIWLCHLTDVPSEDVPGTLMSLGKEGFLVCTGTDCIQIEKIQMEGREKVSAREFSRGHRIMVGERFLRENQVSGLR